MEVDEEQHPEDLQADALDGEQVARQHAPGGGAEEGPPGQTAPLR